MGGWGGRVGGRQEEHVRCNPLSTKDLDNRIAHIAQFGLLSAAHQNEEAEKDAAKFI